MEEILALRIYKTIVGIVGILGNGLVCVVIGRVTAMQTRTNAFIFHQAVIDFVGCAIIILHSLIPVPDVLPDGATGWFICVLWTPGRIMFMAFAASTYNLLAMTMERYFAIVHPFKYQAAFARHPQLKVGSIFLVCWIFGVTLYMLRFNRKIQNGECLFVSGSQYYGVAVVFLTYVVPVAVMLFAYICTSIELKRGADRVGPSFGQAAGMAESLLRARRNTFKTLLIVFITFLICWTPNEIRFLIYNSGFPLSLTEWQHLVTIAMVATNSCINPIIYAFKYNQFRKGLREVFCGRRSQPDVSDVGSVSQSLQNRP